MDQYTTQYQYGQYQGLLPETGGMSPAMFGVILLAIGLILVGLFVKDLFNR